MAFLDKDGLQTLTNKLVQGDAIKVASHRGHTVTNVIDNITRECENIATPNTMTLENKVNEFKVGKGRNVDVSRDVEEGKIEVELQGKTYHNLCDSNASASIQYADDYKVEDTEERLKITRNAENYNGWFYFSNRALKVNMLKPNTTYTVFFKYESISNNIPRLQFMLGNATQWLSDAFNSIRIKDNIYRCVIKTVSSFEDKEVGKQVIYFHNAQPKKTGDSVVLYKNMLLLEGDYSDLSVEELPNYFERIKSSFENGVVDVEVTGKNLLNKNNIVYNKWIDSANGLLTGASNTRHYMDYTKIEGGRTIILSGCTPTACYVYSDIGVCIGERSWQGSFNNSQKLPIEAKYIRFTFDSTVAFENMQLEYSTNPTTYEPYYKKKISFNIGEPLRSLPNGVCDEIKNNNGQWELVRRVEKTVFNGNEDWQSSNAYTGFSRFLLKLNSQSWTNNYSIGIASINDKVVNRIKESHGGYEYIYIQGSSSATNCYYQLNTSKASSLVEFKQLLSENPTTVYYELAEPIITLIKPIEFEVKPLSTMSINSEIAPVSNHKVVLNRAGQIEQGIVRIAELKKRVDSLETTYDSYLLETQHKLSLLGFEYELESEEI